MIRFLLAALAAPWLGALLIAPPLVAQAPGGRVLEGRTFQSPALGREWAYTVYLPPGYEGDERAYPSFYLLHGYGGEHTNWARYGDAAMTADSLIAAGAIPPVILVMPDGQNSYWVDSDAGSGFGAVETALVQDLVPHVDRTYRTIPLRRARMIGGLSMGGYGAVHLALKHPELFGAAASLTGALSRVPPERTESLTPAFGDPFDAARWQAENPFALIAPLQASELRLPIYLTVGDDDGTRLLEGAVDFHAALRAAELPSELRITDGPHSWEVWDHALRETLVFFAEVFRARYR
jgi:S-formylglutathione hydrolase FrmB